MQRVNKFRKDRNVPSNFNEDAMIKLVSWRPHDGNDWL